MMDEIGITREMVDKMRDDWNMTCLVAGIPAITTDTCEFNVTHEKIAQM